MANTCSTNRMDLSEFLVQAKIATYAANGESGETKLAGDCRELTFEKAQFKYKDQYFGQNKFIGEEIVWENDVPIWGMNYFGSLISQDVSPKDIYEFLKSGLKKSHD